MEERRNKSPFLRRLARTLASMFLSLIVTLVGLEAGFRLFPQTIPRRVCLSSSLVEVAYCKWYYRFDDPPRLGYTYRPGYHFEGPFDPADPVAAGEGAVTCPRDRSDTFSQNFTADQNGFVNSTPLQDHYDIVLTGDSFTQQYAPVWWVKELESQTGLSVLNLGMPGWGPLSEVEAVHEVGLDKTPDWTILLYFEGNDIFNTGMYLERQSSGLDWRTYEIKKAPFLEHFITYHVLSTAIKTLGGAYAPPLPSDCRYPIVVTSNVDSFETVFSDNLISQLSFSKEQIEGSDSWAALTASLASLNADVRAGGGRFLLVFVPAKEHIYWGMIWDPTDLGNFLLGTWPSRNFDQYGQTVEAQRELIGAFAAQNNIELVDLTTPLWLAARNQGAVYNYADSHWNIRGNEIAAQTISDYILSHP